MNNLKLHNNTNCKRLSANLSVSLEVDHVLAGIGWTEVHHPVLLSFDSRRR